MTQLSLPLAMWLVNDKYDYADNPYELSATTLLHSPRYIIAKLRKEFPEEFDLVSSDTLGEINLTPLALRGVPPVASRMGDAVHHAIETVTETRDPELIKKAISMYGCSDQKIDKLIQEHRFSRPLGDFIITGKVDYILNGKLHDIKTTSTYTATSGVKDIDYIRQGSIYRWLIPQEIIHDEMVIDFIFKDWSKNKVKDDYPPLPVMSKTYRMMSEEETEVFLLDKLNQIKEYWNAPLQDIPCCPDEDIYRLAQPSYKYYATGYAEGKRATRVLNTLQEAEEYRAKKGGGGEIVFFQGEPRYCPMCEYPYFKE